MATVRGFAMPRFHWRVNGVDLFGAEGSHTVPAQVSIDDPAHPDAPTHTTQPFSFSYAVTDEFSHAALDNRLVLWNHSYAGHYVLDLEVEVREVYDGDGATKATRARN